MSRSYSFVFSDPQPKRLDVWLAELLKGQFSRTEVQAWIQNGCVKSQEHKRLLPSLRPHKGDSFCLTIPKPERPRLEPLDLGLRVLYEDDYLAVVHKPAGLPTHPGPGDRQPSIAHGILHIWKHLLSKNTPEELRMRPGIVHRLDKATEGLLLIGLEESTRRKLMRLFQERKVQKRYEAWVHGRLPAKSGRIELGIRRHPKHRLKMQIHPEGRLGITEFEEVQSCVSKKGERFSQIRLGIETGRTHQIRVQLAHIGTPIVGDALYSRKYKQYEEKFGMLLYAKSLGFRHPVTGQKLTFSLDEPERFGHFQKYCAAGMPQKQ